MDRVTSLVSQARAAYSHSHAHHGDVESGLPAGPAPAPASASASTSGPAPAAASAPLPPDMEPLQLSQQVRERLRLFRVLVGIINEPSLVADNPLTTAQIRAGVRPAPNLGIYVRCVRAERINKDSYHYFSILINSCLGLQIIVAAALTAMGAANSSHSAITAFGAINTIIAGFLTYLKGSGLPNRLKYYHNEWKKLREYIEQRERDFSREDCPYDLHEVVAIIEQLYEETKRDIEVNTPDGYNSVVGGIKRPTAAIEAAPAAAAVAAATSLSSSSAHAKGSASGLLRDGDALRQKLEGLEKQLEVRFHKANDNVESDRSAATEGLEHGEKQLEGYRSSLQSGQNSLTARLKGFVQDIEHGAAEIAHDTDTAVREGKERVTRAEHEAVENTTHEIRDHAKEQVNTLTKTLDDKI